MAILGIDAGNDGVKVVSLAGAERFSSAIGEYRERKLRNDFGDDDMEFEYNGRRGFAGTLAKYESEFSESMKGDSKANEDAKLRILLALHRYGTDDNYDIVVGQPIRKHNDIEKEKIKAMLKGKHTITVNGVEKRFLIRNIGVAAEGACVGLLEPHRGRSYVLDIGSGTINWAAIDFDGEKVRFIDRDSDTETFGMSTIQSTDMTAMVRRLAATTLVKWDSTLPVRVVGASASSLIDDVKAYYPQAYVFQPTINWEKYDSVYANAATFYTMARNLYGKS